MNRNYRDIIYEDYITNQLATFHPTEEAEKEQKILNAYFYKNYSKYLPSSKTAQIVDLGCGMGHFLSFLKTRGYTNVLGVDVSIENVDFCHAMNLNVLQENIVNFISVATNSLDCVVLNDVIEHFTKEEIVGLLSAIKERLAENGCVIMKTDNMSNPITGVAGRYIDFTHEIGFTETSIKEVLTGVGFRNVKVFGADIYVLYSNPLNYPAKFLAWIMSKIFYFFNYLYGRKTLKIFEKDIIAVAYRNRHS